MKRLIFLALTVAGAMVFIACGGGGSNPDPNPGTTNDHSENAHEDEQGAEALHVILSEWSITGEDGETTFTADAGDTIFEIHNEGAAPHDLKIIKTNLEPDALPAADGVVNPEAAGEVIGSIDPLPGNIEVKEPYDLAPGRYVLICSIPGHYQQGMFAELTVE